MNDQQMKQANLSAALEVVSQNGPIPKGVAVYDITKTFGTVKALRGVTLQVQPGEVFSLLGPNGSGKTTLIRILTTLLQPTSGMACVAGADVTKNPNTVRSRIGLAGQYATVDELLTGYENLALIGRLYHLTHQEVKVRAINILKEFSLTFAKDRALSTYSGGMRRRLDLATSLMGNPKVLFLDEPTTGLDPKSRKSMWRTIRRLANEGVTIFLTTQYLDEADALADRIAILEQGQIVAEGTPDSLKRRIDGDILEIHLEDPKKTADALRAIRAFSSNAERIEVEPGKILLPVSHGTTTLVDVVFTLQREDFTVLDVSLRRPNLDEVFLALTGRMPEDTAPQQAPPNASGWAA